MNEIDVIPIEVTLEGDSALIVELLSGSDGLSGLDVEVTTPDAVDIPSYDGAYEVTPRLRTQRFETENKRMTKDVTVYKIPVVYTSNIHDGKTVVIG